MPQLIRDVHVSGLRYVGESVERRLTESNNVVNTSGKYRRFSIPRDIDRHCLGYIEGPAASLTEDTRNGRGYVLRLWQNVENSADFQEGMQCATIIGENDHPEERVDYSLTKGSIVLTDWEIREDEGIVWARFAILDNDEGRTLLSYVKFGTVIGVSSRGLGDEIVENGRTIIDPDTYEFYCFDAVAFPAATVARTKFVEKDAVTESTSVKEAFSQRVLTETTRATTHEELMSLKNVVESTNVPDKDSLVESITDKLSSLSESTDNQSNIGDEVEADDADKQILLSNLAEKDAILDTQAKELEDTRTLLKRRSENANYFRRVVQEQQAEIESLNDTIEGCLQSVADVSSQYESINSELSQMRKILKDTEKQLSESRSNANRYKQLSERKVRILENEVDSYRRDLREAKRDSGKSKLIMESIVQHSSYQNEKIMALESSLAEETARSVTALRESKETNNKTAEKVESVLQENAQLKEEINSLKQQNEQLKAESASAKSKLHESVTKNKRSNEQTAVMLDNYLKKCCEAYNIEYNAAKTQLPKSFTMSDVDRTLSEMADRQARFDMLPVMLTPRQGRIVEHRSSNHLNGDNNTFLVRALNGGQ